MAENKEVLKKFVTTCTVTFKAFDYSVELARSSATVWHFVTVNPKGDKSYAVYCAPRLDKAKSLIKIAMKKLKGMRLVVVTQAHTEEDLEKSRAEGYALLTLDVLNQYGEEMIEARARETEEVSGPPPTQSDDTDPLASSREKVF